MTRLQIHPLADLFPLMQGEKFDELCADIQQNGLINSIIRQKGLVVDGRNRLRACEKLQRAPRFVEFDSLKVTCTPEEYIWAQNMARRHLTDNHRAGISVKWGAHIKADALERQKAGGKAAGRGRPNKVVADSPQPIVEPAINKTRHKLAEMAQVTEHKIRQAEKINEVAPELLEKVIRGEITLGKAAKEVAPQRVPKKKKTVEFDPEFESARCFDLIRETINRAPESLIDRFLENFKWRVESLWMKRTA